MILTTSTIIWNTPLNFSISYFQIHNRNQKEGEHGVKMFQRWYHDEAFILYWIIVFHMWENITGSTILRKGAWQHVFFSAALDDRFW